MNCPAVRVLIRNGFTLVEMMVVLAIMAGLVTVASFSVETTLSKARADKTTEIGRQVIEDLERSDSRSFVSDFGRLPRDANELKFIFSKKVVNEVGIESEAAAHQFRTLELPATIPAGAPVGSAGKLADVFGAPEMGVGWRGPYSVVTQLRSAPNNTSLFLDGWKNEWETMLDGAAITGLRSLGRNNTPGGVDWQDKDLEFLLTHSPVNVDLQGQLLIRAANGSEYTTKEQFTDFTLRIIYFAPEFDTSFPVNGSNGNIATVEFTWNGTSWVNPARPEQVTANPFQFRLGGLTAGHRAIFIYAIGTPTTDADTKLYGGGLRLIHLHHGTNRIEFRLTEL